MRRSTLKIVLLFTLVVQVFAVLAAAEEITEEQKAHLFNFGAEDYLVEAPTRFLKLSSQTDKNVSVLDAEDIRNFNAHTLAEVLNRITGVYVSSSGDFGASSLLEIHGGLPRHTNVTIDGISLNFLSESSSETFVIPVGIISRVEVVKDVASSAWGSALGGTINIITKDWENPYEHGLARISYGSGCFDYRAELSGRGPVDYYLYLGSQLSDGLREKRSFKSFSLYTKIQKEVNTFTNIKFTFNYSLPEASLGDIKFLDLSQNLDSRILFATASLESLLTSELRLDLSIRHLSQKFDIANNSLGLGQNGPRGELYMANLYDEKTTGASGKLIFERPGHVVVFGADFDQGKLDHDVTLGLPLTGIGGEPETTYRSSIDKFGIFVNDSYTHGNWSISPSLRFDRNNRTGSFLSPGLGVVYAAGKNTLIRGSAGRGFSIPSISWTTGGATLLDPNPSLDVEKVWSFQAGVESRALKYVWVKAFVFQHEIEDAITPVLADEDQSNSNRIMINCGKYRRKGLELEAETAPFHDFSFYTGFSCVDIDPFGSYGAEFQFTSDIAIRYDDESSLRAELFGHYVDWGVDESVNSNYNFIWDLNVRKKISTGKRTAIELFLSVHNIFQGSQQWSDVYKTTPRWGEVGLRLFF